MQKISGITLTTKKFLVPSLNTNTKSKKELLSSVETVIEKLKLKDMSVDILKHDNGYSYARIEGPYLAKSTENKLRELVYKKLKIGIAYILPYMRERFASDVESIFKKEGFNISASLSNEKWKKKSIITLTGEFPKTDLHKYLITMTTVGKMAIDKGFFIKASTVFDKDSNVFKLIS